ncbi:amidohydrolase family protein [Polymorphobacter sp.]|uniref:amidohydrolase family protein n=1 Tax=Polymorphobacter sp. TaxID=1909290 RepID=UPI003F70BC38
MTDTLITNAYVITIDPQRRVYTNGHVAMAGGRITSVGPMADAPRDARETIDAKGKVVMPGFANTHNHLVQGAFRGYNDDRWPVLDLPTAVKNLLHQLFTMTRRMDGERTNKIVRLHMLDMLKSGYTATHDEHFTNICKDSADGAFSAVAESGMRGFLARCIVSGERVPEAGSETAEAGLIEVERLRGKFNSDRLEIVPGILNFHFFEDVEDMRRIRQGADHMGSRLDVDMTDNSRGGTLKARGFNGGQLDYYASFGVLDGPIYAGKGHELLPSEMDSLADRDARFSLVPVLRFFDGRGLPVHHFLSRGILPGLGTDAPLVADCQSPFEMMRKVILAQNLAVKREQAEGMERPAPEHWVTAETVLEMATLGGARTLFMEETSGSLEPGKAADLIIVDLDRAETQPTHGNRRTPGMLVWAAQSSNVDTVFVAGEKLIEGGRSTRWNEETVIAEAAQALADIAEETGLYAKLPSRTPGQSFRNWQYL